MGYFYVIYVSGCLFKLSMKKANCTSRFQRLRQGGMVMGRVPIPGNVAVIMGRIRGS